LPGSVSLLANRGVIAPALDAPGAPGEAIWEPKRSAAGGWLCPAWVQIVPGKPQGFFHNCPLNKACFDDAAQPSCNMQARNIAETSTAAH